MSSQPERDALQLFEVVVRVHRNVATCIPTHFSGARITAYAVAADAECAERSVHARLRADGFDIAATAGHRQLAAGQWDRYVEAEWPGMRAMLPTQAEVERRLTADCVFFGSLYPCD
jgi:hypothetical protein